MKELDKLAAALSAKSEPGKLINGAPLIMENIDISPLGLYRESEVDTSDPDIILWSSKWVHGGERLFFKASEKKIVVFSDNQVVLHKELLK